MIFHLLETPQDRLDHQKLWFRHFSLRFWPIRYSNTPFPYKYRVGSLPHVGFIHKQSVGNNGLLQKLKFEWRFLIETNVDSCRLRIWESRSLQALFIIIFFDLLTQLVVFSCLETPDSWLGLSFSSFTQFQKG